MAKKTSAKKPIRVPVLERALLARINRTIETDGLFLRRSRPGTRSFEVLGRYHLANRDTMAVLEADIDLENYARELGLLADHEYLEIN